MTRQFRAWLEETHGTRFELVRHFLARFFDNDMISIPGEWQKVAIGIFASLISFGLCAFSFYWTRYRLLHSAAFDIYRQGVRDDLISFIALGMAVTALLTILQWQSLFPSLRDLLALAGLPIRAREVFLAKFGSLLLVFAVFVLAMTALPSVLYAILTNFRHHENPETWISMAANFAAFAGSCVFVFFTLLAIQGVLLQLLSAHAFARVSIVVQAVLFILTVGAIPLVGSQPTAAMWWPPVWFVRLWEAIVLAKPALARPALYALTLPVALSVAAYLLSYHRYRRMLLESQPGHGSARWSGLGARLLERFLPDPREQGAFSFIGTTLFRSRSHRLLLLSYAGVALGWTAKGLVESPPVHLRDEGLYGLTVVLAPIAVAILITVGLRYLFALPVMLRANWVFQTVETEDRPAWHAAIEKFVVWAGIVPIFAAGLPAAVAVLGPFRGTAAMVLAFIAALLFFERYFRQWRKLPFTCSYLPGQQTVWMVIFRVFVASGYLLPLASLFLWASAEATSFIALSTGLGALWLRWHAIRRREWAASVMLWDELPPPPIEALDLGRAKTDDAPLSMGSLRPRRDFGEHLVASRGILPAAWSEEIEDERRSRAFWETLWEDMRYGARLIRRSPLLSTVVVATLTIGIGLNASIFTVLSGTALTPHVYRDPASFVRIFPKSRQDDRLRPVSAAEYNALRDRNRSMRQLAAFRNFPALIGDDDSTGTPGLAVSCNFFLVEGLDRALMGRLFDPDDCRAPGQAPVAILSEAVWRKRFGADPHIIGRIARINSRSVPVVGVVATRTSLWAQPNGIWLPYTAQPWFDTERNFFHEEFLWLNLAGRLTPGYTRARAGVEFAVLERQLDADTPGRQTLVETTDGSWFENFELMASASQLFLMAFFLGAFHLVLFIACANVATLLLSRAASRRREIAVRLSLGAPRVRLVRMLVTEALLLAAIAGAASVWLVYRVPQPLWRFISPRSPEMPLPPDWEVFAYVSIVVLLTGIASGLAPALESVKVDLAQSMKSAGGNSSGGSGTRGWLVTAQVGMSMVLLVSAALLGKSEDRNLRADPGYLPRHVVVAPLRFPETIQPAAARVRMERIAARVRVLPGVRNVAFSEDFPMIDHYTVEVRPPARADAVQPVDVYSGAPGFMQTLGERLLRGRDFDRADRNAVIVSESLERAFFRRPVAVGRVLQFPSGPLTIIGVARDIAPLRVGGSENPPVWTSQDTHPARTFLSVRFATPALANASSVRGAVAEVEPNLMVIARNLQGWIDMVTEELWNMVTLIVILGLVATVLAATGIYGAVSFTVNQRMRDLGIRVALGAQRSDVVREVLLMGGGPVLRGLLLGSWLSVAVAASLRESLRGSFLRVDSTDPLIYVAAVALLAAAALVAMFGPARRGTKADPLDTLRCE
jgi:predicted permease